MFSPELITVASHSVGIEPSEKTDVSQGTASGAEPTEKAKRGKDKAATIDSGEGTEPSKADTPHNDEMIDALKYDGGNGGHEEDPEVAIVGESKSVDDVTLAALKAEQDKCMQLKG